MFEPAALQHLVATTLAEVDIPADKRGACVLVANQDSVKAVLAVRVGDGWKVQAVVEHEWTNGAEITYGVSVVGTW